MITINSYSKDIQNINWAEMPEALAKGNKLVEGASQNNWSAYNSNENIKCVVDAYLEKLNQYLEKNKPAPAEKKLPSKAKSEAKKSPSKSSTTQPRKLNYKGLNVEIRPFSNGSSKFIVWDVKTDQKFANEKFDTIEETKQFILDNEMENESEEVERIDTDVQFIKRYAGMHGKVKSQAQILSLLHSLQKAILERRINKDSPYSKEVNNMQDQLIKVYEKMGEMAEIKIDSKNLKTHKKE